MSLCAGRRLAWPQQHGREAIGERFSRRRPWHRSTLRSAWPPDPADLALCVDGARDLLPVRAERHLERLHDPTAQHAIPGVALEREHGGGAAADGDRRVLLHRQRGDQPVKKRWLIRESQCEVSTIHESAP